MTTIKAEVIAYSMAMTSDGAVPHMTPPLVTLRLTYPRFIHAEFMTHRVFSRNASSSRAIPVERLIADVEKDPAVPLYWGRNQRGMQAGEDWDEMLEGMPIPGRPPMWVREAAWFDAKSYAVEWARRFAKAGYHKQIVNRLLEPFAHIRVVVTATEWENFFALRNHPDAEPHIQHLAREMQQVMVEAHENARYLSPGEWHLPFITDDERAGLTWAELRAVSVARCARVSYLTHDNRTPKVEEDMDLYARLVGSSPLHASPAEHQATPDVWDPASKRWQRPTRHGNLVGWIQYRKILEQQGV